MECKGKCGFFASSTNEYCSKCSTIFTDNYDSNDKVCVSESKETTISESTRCFKCNKKLRTNILICKCNHSFCSAHIYSTDHNCKFDYKEHGKELLRKQNPVVEKNSRLNIN